MTFIKKYRLLYIQIGLLATFLSLHQNGLSQITSSIDLDSINSNSNREEIQRYFGFEDVLFRYTTQPYDLTMNINETANFLDIGPLYLIVLPLLFIFLFVRRKKLQILGLVGLLIYLISCLFFSKIVTSSSQFITSQQILQGGLDSQNFSASAKCLLPFYKGAIGLFHPIYSFIDQNIHTDLITYPIFFLLFFGLMYLASQIKNVWNQKVTVVYLGYGLLFFMLSAGILWYGFLMLPLSLIMIYLILDKLGDPHNSNVLKKGVLALSPIIILGFLFLRLSNIQPNNAAEEKGKNLFYANVFSFSTGQNDEGQSLDLVFPGISKTLSEINQNNDLVYKVGTSLTIHIQRNNERVYSDNQLSMFYHLLQSYDTPNDVFRALKEYGFSYLLLDLHTASIDRTPDKSLTKKYQLLLESIYNNPNLTLLNTDRRVQISTGEGVKTINALFGQVEYFGNYAVYKLR